MSIKICGRPATVEYDWAGKFYKSCLEHANQVATLGEFIGSPIRARVIDTDETCKSQDEAPEEVPPTPEVPHE